MMYRPNLVANYFIKKSLDTGTAIIPIKLLKLVCIAHGWYLALTEEDLINEGIQAWKFGVVIPSVFHKFKIYGNENVTATAQFDTPDWSTDPFEKGEDISNLSLIAARDKLFLDRMWELYRDFTPLQLASLTTEKNTPWDIVWKNQIDKNKTETLIPNDLIKQYYKGLLKSA